MRIYILIRKADLTINEYFSQERICNHIGISTSTLIRNNHQYDGKDYVIRSFEFTGRKKYELTK